MIPARADLRPVGGRGVSPPRLSSVLSAPTSTAETRDIPASRIISPTAWILAHDDRPAVTTATAPVAQVARCSAPSDGIQGHQGEQQIRRGIRRRPAGPRPARRAATRGRRTGPAGACRRRRGPRRPAARRPRSTVTPGSRLRTPAGAPRERRRTGPRQHDLAYPPARTTAPAPPGQRRDLRVVHRNHRQRGRAADWPGTASRRCAAIAAAHHGHGLPPARARPAARARTVPTLSRTGAPSACATSSRRRSRSDTSARMITMPRPSVRPTISPRRRRAASMLQRVTDEVGAAAIEHLAALDHRGGGQLAGTDLVAVLPARERRATRVVRSELLPGPAARPAQAAVQAACLALRVICWLTDLSCCLACG